jgi:phytoene synthase
VGEDWDRGRLYLPLDALARHGLGPDGIGALRNGMGRLPDAYRDLMEELIGTAERKYRMAFQAIPALPDYFQRPVLVSALIYREIHGALRRNGYDNFNLRAHSTAAAKLGIGVRALWILPSIRDLYPPSPAPLGFPASLGRAASVGREMAYGH